MKSRISHIIYSMLFLIFPLFGHSVETGWQWNDLAFPKDFLWGAATCEYQNSGAFHVTNIPSVPDNATNWTDWENQTDKKGRPHIKNGEKSGRSANHWDMYKTDIGLMKDMGMNSYRFSISWNRIQPTPPAKDGTPTFDKQGMQHYIDLCDELNRRGIKPMLTLHHFCQPLWFDKMGGWEKEENIKHFQQFCKHVYLTLKDKVAFWCTINEPTCYSMMAYFISAIDDRAFPPGKGSPHASGTVLKNMLKAHCQVYDMIKDLPGGEKAQVGIVHSLLKFEAYHWWSPWEQMITRYFTHITNGAFMKFFRTGDYTYYSPWGTSVQYEDLSAPYKMDFIGLNYYSRALISGFLGLLPNLQPTHAPGEVMTDMPYAMYPKGFYEAIQDVSAFKVPIYITENGIGDSKDDRRAAWIYSYLNALNRAIKDGYDVRGYYYWTLTDNFEWDEGTTLKFGLYDVNKETYERTLKNGAKPYRNLIRYCTLGELPVDGNGQAEPDVVPAAA